MATSAHVASSRALAAAAAISAGACLALSSRAWLSHGSRTLGPPVFDGPEYYFAEYSMLAGIDDSLIPTQSCINQTLKPITPQTLAVSRAASGGTVEKIKGIMRIYK